MNTDTPSDFSMTVGELAYALRLDTRTIKASTNARTCSTELSNQQLDDALDLIRGAVGFKQRGWDLSLLENLSGEWVQSLRTLYSVPVSFPASLPPSQGMQLREVVLREQPERVLEIGCFIGVSSHWIASALEDLGSGSLDSVDTFWPKYPIRSHFSYLSDPFSLAVMTARESSAGRRIHFHLSDSAGFADTIQRGQLYDLIFIDGDHHYEGVCRDILALFPYLRKNGVIVLHDTNPAHCGWDGPRRLIDNVLADNPNVEVEEIETQPNFGMAVVRKITTATHLLPPTRTFGLKGRIALYRAQNQLRSAAPLRPLVRHVVKPLIANLRYRSS